MDSTPSNTDGIPCFADDEDSTQRNASVEAMLIHNENDGYDRQYDACGFRNRERISENSLPITAATTKYSAPMVVTVAVDPIDNPMYVATSPMAANTPATTANAPPLGVIVGDAPDAIPYPIVSIIAVP